MGELQVGGQVWACVCVCGGGWGRGKQVTIIEGVRMDSSTITLVYPMYSLTRIDRWAPLVITFLERKESGWEKHRKVGIQLIKHRRVTVLQLQFHDAECIAIVKI